MSKHTRRWVGGCLAAFILLGVVIVALSKIQALTASAVRTAGVFATHELAVSNLNLFDIGCVDFDGDGAVDIFSTNHQAPTSLLANQGQGQFVDVAVRTGLSQDHDFPGLEIAAAAPDFDRPGLYIFWLPKGLVIHQHLMDASRPALRISMPSRVDLGSMRSLEAQVIRTSTGARREKSIVQVASRGNGRLELVLDHSEVPVTVELVSGIEPAEVFVGQNRVSPRSTRFQMLLGDRHGMAWADFDRDGRLDVFVARGGLRGQLKESQLPLRDELFRASESGHLGNMAVGARLEKGGCPGYNVKWVDFDGDGYLDVYVTCHHGEPNRLFKQMADGTLSDVAASMGVDLATMRTDTPIVWLDFNQDGLSDLVALQGDNLTFFLARARGQFVETQAFDIPGLINMSVGDFDSDGDLDLLAVSYAGGSSLLVNLGGRFERIAAQAVGLPQRMVSGNWVDYDGDGKMDVFAVPTGLYRQAKAGQFVATGILSHWQGQTVRRARSSWCDLDGDGRRDLILATYHDDDLWLLAIRRLLGDRTPHFLRQADAHGPWIVRRFVNEVPAAGRGHWLQLDVLDGPGNSPAIGAHVLLEAADYVAASLVGESDGSLASQGHYRLYYGIPAYVKELKISVLWPGGERESYIVGELDRLVTLRRDNWSRGVQPTAADACCRKPTRQSNTDNQGK